MKKNSEDLKLDIDTLGYYMTRALCVMIKSLHKELKEYKLGIKHPEFAILKILGYADCMSQTKLAEIIGKEKSGIGRSISSLEKEGYVYRCAITGCKNKVCLTEKGKEIMPVINEIANKVSEKAFIGFSPKKKTEMMKNLTLIYENSL